jgi:two-component system, NarL family, sensor kinase
MAATVPPDLSRPRRTPVTFPVGTSSPVTAGLGRPHDVPVRWVLGAAAVGSGAAGALLHAANAATGRVAEPSFWLMGFAAALGYGLAALMLHGDGSGRLRLLLGSIGLAQGLALLCSEAGLRAPDAPPASVLVWVGSWLWAPAYVATGTMLPLLMPDGRLPGPRWRVAGWVSALAVVGTAASWALTPYAHQDFPEALRGFTNPVGVEAVGAVPVGLALGAVLMIAVLLAAVSVVTRLRASTGVVRQQWKWVLLGLLVTVATLTVGRLLPLGAAEVLTGLAMLPLPLAIAVAVQRHGLWDVDVVLSRGLVYVGLLGVLLAGYVVLVRLSFDRLGPETTALAAAGLALLVLPMHGWLRRRVNRMVHGDVDEPYAVLARLGDRLAAAADPDDVADRVLPSVVEQLAGALRARAAVLSLRDGSSASYGSPLGEATLTVPLDYAGEPVGRLEVWRGGGFGWADRAVLDRLGSQAAVAAHTVLLARETRRARETTVLAREEERRRLRRDLHDGVGPSLAAVALQVETARDIAADDPHAAVALLDRLVPRLNAAVADVRALVYELRPPTLDELGLAAAVRELSARLSRPSTTVKAACAGLDGPDGLGGVGGAELPAAVEVAAYRIVGEAVTNAVRHADAARVLVALDRSGDELVVRVEDDGRGFAAAEADAAGGRGGDQGGVGLTSMRHRAEELGGSLTIATGPGGTTVTGRLPLGVAGTPVRPLPAGREVLR